MLLAEESVYLKEYVHKTHDDNNKRLDEMKQKAEELKLKGQAEDMEIAAQKRIQQYKNRCEELRSFKVALNKKDVTEAVLKQIYENKTKQEVEKELEKMWHKVSMKNHSLMVAYEEEEKSKQLQQQQLINEILKNQMEGKKRLEEERIKIQHEEQEMVNKLRKELRLEEERIMQEKMRTQQEISKEMEEYNRKCAEIKAKRNLQENLLNEAFCQLINEELEKEKSLVHDNRAELRKEGELFRADLQKRERARKLKEKQEEALRVELVAKVEAEKEELRFRMKESREKLQKDVLLERQKQIEEKKRILEEQRKKHNDEIQLASILRKQNIELDKEQEKKLELERQAYRNELKQQIEYNRQMMLKQCEYEERSLKEQLMKEEQYLTKAKQYLTEECSRSTHPFMAKLQGQAI